MKVGDRIRKRGFAHQGVITTRRGFWARIDWDNGVKPIQRPLLCHVNELELVGKPANEATGPLPEVRATPIAQPSTARPDASVEDLP